MQKKNENEVVQALTTAVDKIYTERKLAASGLLSLKLDGNPHDDTDDKKNL